MAEHSAPTRALPHTDNTCAVVLAGGQGRRVGGRDKGWLLYQQQPMVQHVLGQLQQQTDPTTDSTLLQRFGINANRHIERYQTLGYPVWSDHQHLQAGPLAGMLSSLRWAQSQTNLEWLLFCPCDMLHLPTHTLYRLQQALRAAPASTRLAAVSTAQGPQPLVCLVCLDVLDALDAALHAGTRRVQDWYASLPMVWATVESDSPDAFANLNHSADYVVGH
ncbi:molybdenum cofactor guanylyltransferase [Curvibacter sp. CHRR-16]|uniref:molybdenum cofactor guanylyltransferase MobA n=1 Tax=Curvibacter sp. CHRR-16 TaxID=2835872 RepID=UPI001BDB10D5|nr:molybdenum cofactor guanylyltransferase [Curvibacter sp. CHRR-16]